MTRQELVDQIKKKKSFLCVGLDPDMSKIPSCLQQDPDPLFSFCKMIIDATAPYAVAYKPNTAFFEAYGVAGWQALQKVWAYIPKDCFTIADAKRGDIGNTSRLYAQAFFQESSSGMSFDAITVAPYMGQDSVSPFFEFPNKWVIVLALTSNTGSSDFQQLQQLSQKPLYEDVLQRSQAWGSIENLMYVVGATQATHLADIRRVVPHHFLLVPGVGAQGGSLGDVAKFGLNQDVGLLVNASRAILYASSGLDFAEAAEDVAKNYQKEMETYLREFGILG